MTVPPTWSDFFARPPDEHGVLDDAGAAADAKGFQRKGPAMEVAGVGDGGAGGDPLLHQDGAGDAVLDRVGHGRGRVRHCRGTGGADLPSYGRYRPVRWRGPGWGWRAGRRRARRPAAGSVAGIGKKDVEGDDFGPRGGNDGQNFRERDADAAEAPVGLQGGLVDGEHDDLGLPGDAAIRVEHGVVGVVVQAGAEEPAEKQRDQVGAGQQGYVGCRAFPIGAAHGRGSCSSITACVDHEGAPAFLAVPRCHSTASRRGSLRAATECR